MLPTVPVEGVSYAPHDVAVTPDGTMAVVTAGRMVGLFDLLTTPTSAPSFLMLHVDPEASRQYQIQVDSVEVSNGEAVVLADQVPTGGGPNLWQVNIYSLSRTVSPFLIGTAKYIDASTEVPSSRSHDVEILPPAKVKALVRTSFDNVFVDLVTPGPVPTATLTSPAGSDAHKYMGYSSASGFPVFSSDSVAIAFQSGTSQNVAVTIGATETSPGVFRGHVDFIDFAAAPLAVSQLTIVSSIPSDFGALPLDIALSRDRSEVAIRCADRFIDSPLGSGADVSCYSLIAPTQFQFLQSYGGRGHLMGVDSMCSGTSGLPLSRKRLISASEDPLVTSGFVHLVDR